MRTEQKIFNELIETIVNNSENNEAKITDVELWAKSWKEEMKQALTLTDVVGQSEQLKPMVFELANKLAIAGEGDAAVGMHRIHNRL